MKFVAVVTSRSLLLIFVENFLLKKSFQSMQLTDHLAIYMYMYVQTIKFYTEYS